MNFNKVWELGLSFICSSGYTYAKGHSTFMDSSYHCFTFNHHDMTLTIEKYDKLLDMKNVVKVKVYFQDRKGTKR